VYIIELNADVETGNSKLGNASKSLYFAQHSAYRLRNVSHPVQSFHQIGQILFQIFLIFLFGYLINADSCVSPQLLKALPQQLLVHQIK
jgi:hypothetical protein